jgi:hypothetical protein
VTALDEGMAVTRHIVRNALADKDLYAAANRGPDAMRDPLDS